MLTSLSGGVRNCPRIVGARSQLPTVGKLSKDLLVNVNTIAKAYQELAQEGGIATIPGKGAFVAEPKQIYDELQIVIYFF